MVRRIACHVARPRTWTTPAAWVPLLAVVLLLGLPVNAGDNPAPAGIQQQPPATQPSPAGDGTDALARKIEEMVNQARQTAATQPAPGAPPVAPPAAAPQPPATQPASGCHDTGTTLDMNPPPPDQPQPRFVCNALTVESKPSWGGDSTDYVFTVRNEGEGVLNVKVSPG